MKLFYDDRPIIACSSGIHEHSAIAVIRLSGFSELEIFQHFFSVDLSKLLPRMATFCQIRKGSELLDEVVICFFAAPHSYNGENILEISAHGNPLNVQRIINTFIDSDLCRAALPGEFTYRALLNKKITLSQAEGLDLLINANSNLVFSQGLSLLHGELHQSYLHLRELYIRVRQTMELFFDFLEDVGEDQAQKQFNQAVEQFAQHLDTLYRRTQRDWKSIVSPTVLLVGQVNAGKSSLFNAILRQNRSIVSPESGTTRDYVSEYFTYHGINFRLIDTAGIREAIGGVEREGINRAVKLLSNAFFKILVVNPYQTNEQDYQPLLKDNFDFCVVTHFDAEDCQQRFKSLKPFPPHGNEIFISLKKQSGPIEPSDDRGSIGPELGGSIGPELGGSIGPDSAIETILRSISDKYDEMTKEMPLLIERHRGIINNLHEEFFKFKSLIGKEEMAIVANELQRISYKIDELAGITTPEDVLDGLFKNFCIGK
ncbi:MAG: GTPase [Pseudomonadota bacterium]